MTRIVNRVLNIYYYVLFAAFVLLEALDIIAVMLCPLELFTLVDALYIRGILGMVSFALVFLTFLTYLIPLCINNNYPFFAIPDAVRTVDFDKKTLRAINIPVVVSAICSFILLVTVKPFNVGSGEYDELLWMFGMFQSLSFKANIQQLLWSRRIKQ